MRHPGAASASLLTDRRLRRTFVTGLFAATVFGAVIGTAIGFVAGASPLWAAPHRNHRVVLGHEVPRPSPPARAGIGLPVDVPVRAALPPAYSRPDAEPATLPVAALTPLLAAITPRALDAEQLLDRVESLSRSGVPIPIESRRLPPDTDRLLSPDLASSARLVPREELGRIVGVQMFGVRRQSIFARAGIENGDIVLAINGRSLAGLGPSLDALSFDRRAAVLEIARHGELRVLVVRW